MTTPTAEKSPRRADATSFAVVVAHVAFVFAPVFLAARIGVSPWLIPLWLWFGLSFHGLLNLWHEAAHRLVFQGREANEILGRWVLAPLALGDFETYRARHFAHHRFIGVEGDTKDAYRLDLAGTRMLGFALRCLTLQEAVRKLRSTTAPQEKAPSSSRWLLRAALVQGSLILALLATASIPGRSALGTLLAAGIAWGFVYLYGVASLTMFVASLRTLCEHGLENGDPDRAGDAALRNLACGPLGRLLMGCYGFAEHATHHRWPAIPSYRLRAATEQLVEQGADELRPQASYGSRLAAIVGL